MPLFDDPELNNLFDEHAPGEGAAAGKEAKNPNVTEGQIAGAVSSSKKCKTIEEELFADETPAEDEKPSDDDDGTKAADETANGDPAETDKKGKKHKSDVADLFSEELFSDKKDNEDETPAEDNGDDAGEEDEDEDLASLDLDLASEEATLDFDL
jgi:hypothetical protein